MAVIVKQCPKCGARIMEPLSDGYTGYDSTCVICGKTIYNDKSIPKAVKEKVRRYTAISCQSAFDVNIRSGIIRNVSNVTGQVRFNAKN